jgi:phage terminase large subunit
MSAAIENMRRWRADPEAFVREVLRVKEIDPWQQKGLDALKAGNYRLAFKACKGPGKSAFLAWVGLWFLATRQHPKIVALSITAGNLRDNLWAELAKWMKRSDWLSTEFRWTAERIFHVRHPETWWISARAFSQEADPTQQADALAGVHADSVMFLIDEAGGIPVAVVATAEAGLANAGQEGRVAYMLMAGNPSDVTGALYRACTVERALWFVISISSAPNDPNRTPRVTKEWAQQQIDKYGWDSPYVLINVRGEFPPSASNALLGIEEVEQASKREVPLSAYKDEVKILGVDVARFGDDKSVIAMRQGRACFRMKEFRNIDTMELAGQVSLVIEKHDPDAVFIDQTGIGAGTTDRLRQLGYRVIGIDSAQKAIEATRFHNRRAEMWWKMAEWVKAGGCIPDDAELIGELPGPTYKFDSGNRLLLESKEDMKKRGLPSPNKGDALALTFSQPVAHRTFRDKAERMGLAQPPREYDPFQEA